MLADTYVYMYGIVIIWVWIAVISWGGALNFGLRAMRQKDPTFFFSLAFTERPPIFPTFTQWSPIFNKLLITERPLIW